MDVDVDVDVLARIAWETNRGLQVMDDEVYPDPPWDVAPEWRKELCRKSVRMVAEDRAGAEETHEAWRRGMEEAGWSYGTKNPEMRKHPSLCPWRELTARQQLGQTLLVSGTLLILLAHTLDMPGEAAA